MIEDDEEQMKEELKEAFRSAWAIIKYLMPLWRQEIDEQVLRGSIDFQMLS